MRYSPGGRAASEEEWRKLYSISHGLASELSLEIATAFSIWRLRTFFSLYPLIFLVMGIAALEATYLQGYAASSSGWYYFIGLAAVLSWTCALRLLWYLATRSAGIGYKRGPSQIKGNNRLYLFTDQTHDWYSVCVCAWPAIWSPVTCYCKYKPL